jgi:hypothetical protein
LEVKKMANKHKLVYLGPQANMPSFDVGDWTCNRCLEGFSQNPRERVVVARGDDGVLRVYHLGCFKEWHGDHTLKQLLAGI